DSASREGGLDLSRKETAFAGGDSGAAIVAGKAKESLLYQQVEADDMPQDRPPLSEADKRLLQQWLNDGAAWPLESLAPAPPADAASWLQRLTVREYIESVR